MMLDFAKILPAQAKQRSTIELRIAANIIVRVRMQRLAVSVAPNFPGVVLGIEVDSTRIPVILLAQHIVAAFEQQYMLARGRQRVSQRPSPRPSADDDYVEMICSRHGVPPSSGNVMCSTLRQLMPRRRPEGATLALVPMQLDANDATVCAGFMRMWGRCSPLTSLGCGKTEKDAGEFPMPMAWRR